MLEIYNILFIESSFNVQLCEKAHIMSLFCKLYARDMTDDTQPFEESPNDYGDVYSEVDSLNSLAWSLREVDIERAVELAGNAHLLSLNTRIPYKKGAAFSHKTLGVIDLNYHHYDEALAHFLEAFDLYKMIDFKEEQLQVHFMIADLYMDVEAYGEASVYYKSALAFARAIDDTMLVGTLLLRLVEIDVNNEQYRTGRGRLTQLLSILTMLSLDRPNEVRVMEAHSRYLMCQINCKEGAYDDARTCGLDALALLTPDELVLQIHILLYLGDVSLNIKDMATALLYYQRGLELTRDQNLHHEQIEASLKTNTLMIEMGDVREALKRLERLQKYVRERGTLVQREHVQLLIAKAYTQLGLYQQATPYFTRVAELKDFRFKRDTQTRNAQHSQLHAVVVKHMQKNLRRSEQLTIDYPMGMDTNNVHMDILRQQLHEEIAQREVLIDELNAFSYTVAHDLKSPLNVIAGFTEILTEAIDKQPDLDPDIPKSLEMINKTTRKMDAIIEDLMLLGGVRDREHVTLYPIDMALIIREVEARLSVTLEDSNVTLIKPNFWLRGVGYGPWIEAIWVNYISNAIKYGGKPPVVELGAEYVNNAMVKYWVKDNGSGILEADQTRLFTQFTRLTSNLTKGHGIGLSIVKRIAERLGGEVGVENLPDGGSQFFFTLPAVDYATKSQDDN